jgi:hypothetical protein
MMKKLLGTIKMLAISVSMSLCVIFIYGATYSRLLNRNIISHPKWIEPLIYYVLVNFSHSPEDADSIDVLVITIVHLSIITAIVAAIVLGVKLIWPSIRLRKLIAYIAFFFCVLWLISAVYFNISSIDKALGTWVFLFILDAASIFFMLIIGRWARTQIQTKPGSAESQG